MSPSKFRNKTYANLYRFPDSKNFVFKKYSSEKIWIKTVDGKPVTMKGKDFHCSTGESQNAAKAYQIGLARFNEWLAKPIAEVAAEQERELYLKEYIAEKRDRKLAIPDSQFSKNSKARTEADYNWLIATFGHLRLDQMTPDLWRDTVHAEIGELEAGGAKPRKFFNRRKALLEILSAAAREKLIEAPPPPPGPKIGRSPWSVYINPDEEEDSGDYLEPKEFWKVFRKAPPTLKLLLFIMNRQGPRPGEACAYRWDMIRWNEGKHGRLYIPAPITKTRRKRDVPLNSRVARYLRWLREAGAEKKSPWIFPGRGKPAKHVKSWNATWNRAAAAARVEGSIYWVRGKWITERLEEGRPELYVARYCDTSPEMIRKRYAKRKQSLEEEIAG